MVTQQPNWNYEVALLDLHCRLALKTQYCGFSFTVSNFVKSLKSRRSLYRSVYSPELSLPLSDISILVFRIFLPFFPILDITQSQ